jgi:uncharacterized protein (DUF4415 family)
MKMKMSEEYDFSKGKRGPVVLVPQGKTRITIRLDDDVLGWFRAQVHAAGGGNYQTLINRALREHIKQSREPLEEILRRILREEFRRSSLRGTTGGSRGSAATVRTPRRKLARR